MEIFEDFSARICFGFIRSVPIDFFWGGCLVFIIGAAVLSELVSSHLLITIQLLIGFAALFGVYYAWDTRRKEEEDERNRTWEIKSKRIKERERERQIQRQNELEREERERLDRLKNKAVNTAESIEIVGVEAFGELLTKNEAEIIAKNEEYILKFVKLGSFLKAKRESVEELVGLLREIEDEDELTEMEEMVKEQNHILNQLLVYSLNMITALSENKMVLFFSIYEKFDNLGVFNSHWENDLKQALQDVNENLMDAVRGINDMESGLSLELSALGGGIGTSIHEMKSKVGALVGAQKYNNLLTAVNTYQNYKINKRLGE